MKFLVALALFAAVVNAATVYQPWQRQGVASATASVTTGPQAYRSLAAQPVVSAKAFSSVAQPTVQSYHQPEVVAKSVSTVVQPIQPVQPVQTYQPVQPVVKNVGNVKDVEAAIVRSESDVTADGYNYVYETGNGIAAQSQGSLKKVNDVESLIVQGSFQYQSPEGVPVVVSYIADENGFQPKSDLIPTPPPVPVAIARSLEWIASQPKQVEYEYKKF